MNISSTGDLGDICYALNIIRQIPGAPHTLCLRSSPLTKAKGPDGVQRMFDALAPLIRLQPYVGEFVIGDNLTPVDWKSEDFRQRHFTKGETLMQAHLNHLIKTRNMGRDFTAKKPWLLNVMPALRSKGRIVINRTARYRNDLFPWTELVAHYRHRLLFVGLRHEWKEFIGHHGYVEHQPTKDLLEVAQLIAGSDLFIGNQSSAYAIAEGLKHASIQETNLEYPDCVYVRPNAQYAADGVVTLPDGTVLKGKRPPLEKNTMRVPPRGWNYAGYPSHPVFDLLVKEVSHRENISFEEASDRVYGANVSRCPEFFTSHSDKVRLLRFEQAMENSR